MCYNASKGALQAETAFAVRLDVAFWGRVRWRVTSPALVFRWQMTLAHIDCL